MNSYRNLRNLIMSALFAALAAACGSDSEQAPAESASAPAVPAADIVLLDAAVYTVNPDKPWAEAVAVKDGQIIFVGSSAEAKRYIGAGTASASLGGRMVLPGFQDAHVHPVAAGMDYQGCPLFDVKPDPAAYATTVRACADATADQGGWIVGSGWLSTAFPPYGIPDRTILDAQVPDRPVALWTTDGHTLWVNSKALELAGITRDTPDPVNGRIDRNPDTREPVGGLQESAMDIVQKILPAPDDQRRDDALRYAMKYLNSLGITAWQDASVPVKDDPFELLQTYQRADQRGELTVHVVESLKWDNDRGLEQIPEILEARSKYNTGSIRASTVKIFLDGVIEPQTAALLEDYSDRPGYKGELQVKPEILNQAVAQLDAQGFQIHMHVIGDAAVREGLDALEYALKTNGPDDNRHHLAHVQLVDPADIARFGQLNVTANFQPLWAYEDDYLKKLTLPRVGPERYRWMYPIRSIENAGGRIAFGSDWSVSSPNPLLGIETAVTRMGPLGETDKPFFEQETISLEEAIKAYTLNSAFLDHLDDRTGSIVTGKRADLIVLDHNLFEIPPANISETKVLLTLFGGKPVYGTVQQAAAH